MPGPLKVYRRFIASAGGGVAIEFAAILPVLLIMLLATFDGGRAIAAYMKVRSATYVLATVTNQYSTAMPIQSSNMAGIMSATSAVLSPYSSAPAVVVISELTISAAKKTTGKVEWSAAQNGTALAVGATVKLPASLNTKNNNTCSGYPCYLILAKVSYTYTPLFGYFGSGGIALSDTEYATPRSSTCIPYVPTTGTGC